MRPNLAKLAIVLFATPVLLPAPAVADFAISKPKPAARPTTAPSPPPQPRVRRPRVAPTPKVVRENPPAEPRKAIEVRGFDPAMMQEILVQQGFTATTSTDRSKETALIQVKKGKTGWNVNFKECGEESRCGSIDFYTLWRITNEANVCFIWTNEITEDAPRRTGKPYCFTDPSRQKQFHLTLTTEQPPYARMKFLGTDQARERMQEMISVWSAHMDLLPQAWDIAKQKCPKKTDSCTTPRAPPAPRRPAALRY